MHITQLRLQGFKSFVEPTDLLIRPGLTGVVGPNGCGKSNLLEALRWVMGETSFKAMRGGAMEDVIFSGTQSRPARNSAQVSVFVDNSARTAPAEFNDEDDLEITRVIRRGEGSAYQVNGRAVRAKDVKLLFEDAATGARSHALVRQGQIGEIVNSKPEARRRILEDAAGIAGLHSRRHEAELRLNAAEGNLERLADVMGQMEAQLNSLRRQARHAERYRELSHRIRQLEALQLYLKWRMTGQQVHRAEEELQSFLTQVTRLTAEETEALNQRERLINAIPPLRDEEVKAAAALHRLTLAEESLAKEESQLRARQDELNGALGEARADLKRDEALIGESEEMLAKLGDEVKRLDVSSAALAGQRDEATARLETAIAQVQEAEEGYTALSRRLAEASAGKEAMVAELRHHQDKASALNENRIQLAASREKLLLEGDDGGLEEVAEERERLETDLEMAENRLQEDGPALEAVQAEMKLLQDEKTALELDDRTLQTEIGMIEKLVAPKGQDAPPLLDEIETSAGAEQALWAALGEALEAPLLAADGGARTATASAFWRAREAGELPPLPAGAKPLSDYVTAPPALAPAISMVGVVGPEQALELQKQLKPGQSLVSLDGGLWRWDGYCLAPRAAGEAPLRLTERNRLPLLETERAGLATRIGGIASQLNELGREAERLSLSVQDRRQMTALLKGQLKETITKDRQLRQQATERAQRLAILEEQMAHTEKESAQSAKRSVDINLALASLPALGELEREAAVRKQTLDELRAAHSEAHVAAAGIKAQTEIYESRMRELGEEEARWTRRGAEAEAHIKELTSRAEKMSRELAQLKDMPAEIATRRARLLDEKQKGEATRQAAADRLAEAETLAATHEQQLRRLQTALMTAREEKARVETRLEGARASLMQLASEMEAELNTKPDGCLQLAGLGPEDDLPPLTRVESDLSAAKRDRDRLGAVNLRATEEIQTLEEQFGSMVSESDDLAEAVASLRQAVQQLNEEGRQRLLAAFDKVNGHFKRLFQTLFAGGEAELKLVDSDDPLDAGLEIIARPPGKKPQVLTLLSGGEKALTAMSLIFAVFLTNPSPICVLDEVDAPLDDSNVDRFCRMLEDMARETDTRFLVITHHPMTMERMDRLFGVTMSEKGVSQLVSVDLATAESLRESA